MLLEKVAALMIEKTIDRVYIKQFTNLDYL